MGNHKFATVRTNEKIPARKVFTSEKRADTIAWSGSGYVLNSALYESRGFLLAGFYSLLAKIIRRSDKDGTH